MSQPSLAPNLEHVITSPTLKWVFVGGKGGVGKTTVSCSLGTTIASRFPDKKVLIISTDPAHNTSDAFDTKFGSTPTPIATIPNLSVMEINVQEQMKALLPSEQPQQPQQPGASNIFGDLTGMLSLFRSAPGIDEAIAFSQIIKEAQKMNFDLVIFDTAPTGHTLRFLTLPSFLTEMLAKISSLQATVGPMLGQVGAMLGIPTNLDEIVPKLQAMQQVSQQIVHEFTNPDLTLFVPVLIPEFLPLYETERLLQELLNLNMEVNAVVVNQILPQNDACDYCRNRHAVQAKYLGQIDVLYADFHLVKITMQKTEVRGVEALRAFGRFLEKPN